MDVILKRAQLGAPWMCNDLECGHVFPLREAHRSDFDVLGCPMCRQTDIRLDVKAYDYAEVVAGLRRRIDEAYPQPSLAMND